MRFLIVCFMSCFIPMAVSNAEQPIRAIVFDFGGVIATANRGQMTEFLVDSFHVNELELRAAMKEMQACVANGGSEKQFWEQYAISRDTQLPLDWFEHFNSVIENAIVEIPGTVAIVKELKKQGYQVAMLSDVSQYQATIIRKIGYYDLFQPVVLSYEIGVEKPNPEAYKILLKELQLPALCVLFIDDKLENVEAARALGIDSILFINPKELIDELEKRDFNLCESSRNGAEH